jgi:hypothetical protein
MLSVAEMTPRQRALAIRASTAVLRDPSLYQLSQKGSRQGMVKMEAADKTVSLDLLANSLFRLGLSRRDLAKAI